MPPSVVTVDLAIVLGHTFIRMQDAEHRVTSERERITSKNHVDFAPRYLRIAELLFDSLHTLFKSRSRHALLFRGVQIDLVSRIRVESRKLRFREKIAICFAPVVHVCER